MEKIKKNWFFGEWEARGFVENVRKYTDWWMYDLTNFVDYE